VSDLATLRPDVRRAWTKALRSDRFRQGRGRLARSYVPITDVNTVDLTSTSDATLDVPTAEFCCLGVLCVLALEAGVDVRTELRRSLTDRHLTLTQLFDGRDSYLPTSVTTWSGLRAPNPVIRVTAATTYTTLSMLNDRGTPFVDVADAIEAAT
jgi:hypothetical protein